ncbi:MAG: hypothetical protein IJL17_07155 [Kiritimatiellae bacterium]|nr:hypothetical protein [Kiritimatiellia bacterium]
MRDFIHEWWPVAAVTLFTLFLVVQIPRKVIFPPMPDESAVTPFASFVTLDDDAYAAALQRVRMSWQLRARTQLSGGESRTTAFDFDEPTPAPRTLPVGAAFASPYRVPRAEPPPPAPLLPATLAQSGVEGLAEAAEAVGRPRDAELLELPDSLQEKEKTP